MTNPLDRYPNLPGMLTEFKDGGLQLRRDPSPPPTESVLVLGTAVDGPVMEPVAVDTGYEALFGRGVDGATRLPNGATIPFGFEEAYEAGCRDIRMMRISGREADASIVAPLVEYTEYETVSEHLLDVVSGNVEIEFTLEGTPDSEASIDVLANGRSLAPEAFTVVMDDGDGNTVITLLADQTDSGADIAVTYVDGEGASVTESGTTDGDNVTPWIAQGEDQVFTLQHSPALGYTEPLLMVYGDTPVTPEAYLVVDDTLTLKPNYLPQGTTLTFRYAYAHVEDFQPTIVFRSHFGGRVYNDGRVRVEYQEGGHRKVLLQKPYPKRADSTEEYLEYSSQDYLNLRALVQAINDDPRNGIYKAEVQERFYHLRANTLELTDGWVEFNNGDDELDLTSEEMYDRLHEAYSLLESYNVDYIVPLGVYADEKLVDPHKNFGAQLALICGIVSHRERTTQGVIATTSPEQITLRDVRDHVNALLDHPNEYFMMDRAGNVLTDSEGNPFDLGRYIYVLAGPDRVFRNRRMGRYTVNSPAAFAGFLATLPPNSSALNKVVPNDRGLRYTFSNQQRNDLTGARYVTYKVKGQGTQREATAVEDEMTAALSTSDYATGAVTRQVKETVNRIREVVEPFLGEAPSPANQNALETAIDKVINDELIANGVLANGSTFEIEMDVYMRTMGQSTLHLSLVPSVVRRRINISVSLNPGE